MNTQEHNGVGEVKNRPLSKVLKDKFWLVVVALVIVAAGIMTIALVCTWILRRVMT